MCQVLEEEHSSFRLLKREKMKALLKLLNDRRRRRRIKSERRQTLWIKEENPQRGRVFFVTRDAFACKRFFEIFWKKRDREKSAGGDSAHKMGKSISNSHETRKRHMEIDEFWKYFIIYNVTVLQSVHVFYYLCVHFIMNLTLIYPLFTTIWTITFSMSRFHCPNSIQQTVSRSSSLPSFLRQAGPYQRESEQASEKLDDARNLPR